MSTSIKNPGKVLLSARTADGSHLYVRERQGHGGNAKKHYSPAYLVVDLATPRAVKAGTSNVQSHDVHRLYSVQFNAFGKRGSSSNYAIAQREVLRVFLRHFMHMRSTLITNRL